MSTHKRPLTQMEREGLIAHGLPTDSPSQLSDAFRHGMAWAEAARLEDSQDWEEVALRFQAERDHANTAAARYLEELHDTQRGLAAAREERDILTAQMANRERLVQRAIELEARHSMDPGQAEQRRAESRAVRKALGFGEDADDVSPRDLRLAIERHGLIKQAEELDRIATYTPSRAMTADMYNLLRNRIRDLEKMAKEAPDGK